MHSCLAVGVGPGALQEASLRRFLLQQDSFTVSRGGAGEMTGYHNVRDVQPATDLGHLCRC